MKLVSFDWFRQGTIISYSWLLKPIIFLHKLVTLP